MWLKVEQKRSSIGQKYIVRCDSEIAGKRVVEERHEKGVAAARKTAEMLASSLNVAATVYGADSEGEFVYGVRDVADGAANTANPLIKRLFTESAAASLTFKDQLIANIPEETIKGFAAMSAAMGYIVREHKRVKRSTNPQIGYSTLFRIFCGEGEASTLTLPSDDATIAILTRKLAEMPRRRVHTILMGKAATLLSQCKKGRVWRVKIVWVNGAVHHLGKFTSQEEAVRWIDAHPRLTKPVMEDKPSITRNRVRSRKARWRSLFST